MDNFAAQLSSLATAIESNNYEVELILTFTRISLEFFDWVLSFACGLRNSFVAFLSVLEITCFTGFFVCSFVTCFDYFNKQFEIILCLWKHLKSHQAN